MRIAAAGTLVSAFLAIAAAVPAQSAFPMGTHRMVITCPGGELPFYLQLDGDGRGDWAVSIRNGSERIDVPDVREHGDEMVLGFPHYDSELRLRIDVAQSRIAGEWIKRRGEGKTTRMKVQNAPAPQRFAATPTQADGASEDWCVGRFRVRFDRAEQPAVALLQRARGSYHDLEGTFLTTLGDYRYLAGNVRDRGFSLSCFDGAHAFLFDAEHDPDTGGMRGDFWSSDTWHETFTAVRDDDAALPDGFGLTATAAGRDLGTTTLHTLDGEARTLEHDGLAGTVRVVEIFGTWCPNCHDHGEYLAGLHRRYAGRGLQVVGIACEHRGDRERSARQVRAFAARHGVDYPIWLGGSSDKADATEHLGFVDRVRAFPTTLFVDRQGRVRHVYQGWSGPATGAEHERLKERFEAIVEQLLAEPPPDEPPRGGR